MFKDDATGADLYSVIGLTGAVRTPFQRWTWLGVVGGLIAVAAALTLLAGGTKSPLPHLFYIPVVLAAGVFGARLGVVAALIAGLMCGPLMPLDVEAGIQQATYGWLIRLGFFVLIALVVGVGRNRLLVLSRARQDFLSSVSHELRTPLSSVVGFASLIADPSTRLSAEERQEFAEMILEEATELSNVVDHYVIEGRLGDSALFLDPRPTDLRRIVEIVLEGLPRNVRDQRMSLAGESIVCRADPLRLRQILRSVFNNALAYTSDRVLVRLEASKAQALVIVDDGQAGGHSTLSRLSRWPAPPSNGPPVAAPLGIGLAVSRDLARRMGGDLEYEVNGTTSFRLRLPLVKISS